VSSLWVGFTLVGAAGQVARNAMQRQLTGPLGIWGATNIRFVFGLPFALVFFVAALVFSGETIPPPGAMFGPMFGFWLMLGALSQIIATGLMLSAMTDRSFTVTTAYLKTEAVQTAIFGLVFLGDGFGPFRLLAIVIASVGVAVAGVRIGRSSNFAEIRPLLTGLAAAAGFALSSVGFRGAIISIGDVSFVIAASLTLVLGLTLQTLLLTVFLLLRGRNVLRAMLALWRPSLFAGFVGALASQFWFLAFAQTPVANVRTLALIEVVFAQVAAVTVLRQKLVWREVAGAVLIVVGVALLLSV